MRKLKTLLKVGLLSALFFAFAGSAAAYPTLTELTGKTYAFSSTVTGPNASNVNSEFDFTPVPPAHEYANPQLNNFIFNAVYFAYNETTGVISISSSQTYNLTGISGAFYLCPVGASQGTYLDCQVSEDGNSISFPAFDVRDNRNDAIYATYAATTAVSGGAAPSYPTRDELVGKTFSFTSTLERGDMNTKYDARFAALKADFDFTLSGIGGLTFDDFILKTVFGTGLTATYDQATGRVQFSLPNAPIIGTTGNCYISTSLEEGDMSQPQYYLYAEVQPDGTMIFPDFTVRDYNSDDIIGIYKNAQATTEGIGGGGGEEPEPTPSYPEASELAGWYKYTCSDFKLYNDAYPFTDEITFQIVVNGYNVSVKGFLFESVNAEYDETKGTLTLNSVYFSQNGGYVGIAPDGNWTGMAGNAANKMVWQISEDGDITIPQFELITFSGANKGETLAVYGAGTVEETEEPEPEPEPGQDYTNFVGDYTFTGIKTTYEVENSPITTTGSEIPDYELSFSINEYGQISVFDGYELGSEKIGPYINNKGYVSEDGMTFTLETGTSTGLEWVSGENTYAILFGQYPFAEWAQDQVAFTLTKNADGTYTMSDAAAYLRFSIDNGDGTSQNYNEMYMSWTDLQYAGDETPDLSGIQGVVGMWNVPLTDRPYEGYLNEFTAQYEVTLDGATVTFTEQGESGEGTYNLVGEFISDTTIKFDRAILTPALYAFRMIPFINEDGVTELSELAALYQPIEATYNAEAGTITFPNNSGVLYLNSDDSWTPGGSDFDPKGKYIAAFNFNGVANRTGAIQPELTIANVRPVTEGEETTVSFTYTYANFTPEAGATWTAVVTEDSADGSLGTTQYPATVENGNGSFTMTGLSTGRHAFNVTLRYENAGVTVNSNSRSFTVEAGSYLEITNVVATPDYENGTIDITFDVQSFNVPEGETTYEAVLTLISEEEVMAVADNSITVPATVENGKGTAQITGVEFEAGSYEYSFVVNAYQNGELVAETGNVVTPSVEIVLDQNIEEPAGDITGNMTSQSDQMLGYGDEPDLAPAQECEVTATYNEETNELTIYNFNDFDPITFVVDTENGTLTADGGQVGYVQLPEEDGDPTFVYYYYNHENDTEGISATYRISGEQTIINVAPWGLRTEIEGMGWFTGFLFYNTEVVLDTTLPEPAVPAGPDFKLVMNTVEIEWNEYVDNPDAEQPQIEVSLVTEREFGYMGYQFDMQLPAGTSIAEDGVALGEELAGNVSYNQVDEDANIWRVIANLTNSTELAEAGGYRATENIAIITLDYDKTIMLPRLEAYPVYFTEVDFSTVTGSDMNGKDSEGEIYVTDKTVRTTDIEITSVTLAAPSYSEAAPVERITTGESLDIIVTVEPDDTDEPITWMISGTNETVTEASDYITYDEENGIYVFNSEGLTGDEVTVTVFSGNYSDFFTVQIIDVILGDANDNGRVTVSDAVTTANILVGESVIRFDFPNANVVGNEYEEVVPEDVAGIINIVLDPQNPYSARRRTNVMNTNDALSIDAFKVNGSAPFVVPVNLEADNSYAVLYAAVEIPAGMSVTGVTCGPRAAGHELVYNIEDGMVRLVLFSATNASFANVDGSLFNLEVVASEECGDIRIDAIRAADARCNGYILGFNGGENATGTTGIGSIDADEQGVRYFTVDGIEVFNPEKGQILIRVKDGEVTKVVK